jgi:hypothetical protein
VLGACAGKSNAAPVAGAPGPARSSATAPVSLAEIAPLFFAGESMTFEVSFAGLEGARARVAIGAPALVDGRRVLAMRAEAESSGVVATFREMHDHLSTWIDADSAVPLRWSSDANITGKPLAVDATYAQGGGSAELVIKREGGSRTTTRRFPDGAEVYDPLGALLVLRAWSPAPGATARFYTLGGQRLWRADLTAVATETVKTGLGRFECLRLDGVAVRLSPSLAEDQSKPPRHFSVWIAGGARRLPVKITAKTELGDVAVVATSYDAPAE